jgi:hypothetical protein
MNNYQQAIILFSRIDHLEQIADWIARETTHQDKSICQSATLITVLSDDIRQRITNLIKELETTAKWPEVQ